MILLVVIVYIGIGVGVMLWIKRDKEFRNMETGDALAYGSILFWPITAIIYLALRPPEQIQDLAAKKSYQDFKQFMRDRKSIDADHMTKLDRATTPDKPFEVTITEQEEFRDHHLEDLIKASEWMEATRTANDMLRFAREQQEYNRVEAYEKYLKEIKTKRLAEMG
jgi:hypothetical protein